MTFAEAYLARHGQTEWNVEGRRQGQLDSPLTAKGRGHARAIGLLAATFPIDAIFCSPLGRADSTAKVVSKITGIAVTRLEDLAEIHHGKVASLTKVQISKAFPELLGRRNRDKYNYQFPEGESYALAFERASAAIEFIDRSGSQCPLVISHEMIGRLLLQRLLGLEPADALQTRQPHHTIYRVDTTTRTLERLQTGEIGQA